MPDVAKIKELHKVAREVIKLIDEHMEVVSSKQRNRAELASKTVRVLLDYLEQLEFRMQEEWGFDRDANKHTWWLKPKKCTCPKMDNTDPVYFGGGKIISADCPVHGENP